MPFSGCPPGNQTGRLIPTISNPAVAEGMLQNVPMVLDFAYKYVGNKNAFDYSKVTSRPRKGRLQAVEKVS